MRITKERMRLELERRAHGYATTPFTRALAQYTKAGHTEQPSSAASGFEVSRLGNLWYVLRNANGLLAVFSVRANGRLSLEPDWPAGLELDGSTGKPGDEPRTREEIAAAREAMPEPIARNLAWLRPVGK